MCLPTKELCLIFLDYFLKKTFNVQHFNLYYLCVHVDGEGVPIRPLTPDYTKGHFVTAFETLSTKVGIKNEVKFVDIRRLDYRLYNLCSPPLPQ